MKYMFDGCNEKLIKKIRIKYKNFKEEAFKELFDINDLI